VASKNNAESKRARALGFDELWIDPDEVGYLLLVFELKLCVSILVVFVELYAFSN